jgi:hypothetical protein
MLPTRSQLERWNPDSLSMTGAAVITAAESVYGAVSDLKRGCVRLGEERAWKGDAHDAATGMFGRATEQTSHFRDAGTGVGEAQKNGGSSISDARFWLVKAADVIDEGKLFVADQWVVLIKPARMTANDAARLQAEAEHEQAEINALLLKVGDADDAAAAAQFAAAKKAGYAAPGPDSMEALFPQGHHSQPADEVPNPRTLQGLAQQGTIRGEDMAVTVRDSSEKTDNGNTITTLSMQDGSKQVVTKYGYWNSPGKLDHVAVDAFGKDGKTFVSHTDSWIEQWNNVHYTQVKWADETLLTLSETPDGVRTAGVTMADGRNGVVPPDSAFFTHPVPTTVGGALTALETHADRGGKIPGLTADSVRDVGKTAKFAGPALGLATMIYDIHTAEDMHDACVAGISNVFSVGGGIGGAGVGAGLGGVAAGFAGPFAPAVEPFTVPFLAAGVGTVADKGLGAIGAKVGNIICPY